MGKYSLTRIMVKEKQNKTNKQTNPRGLAQCL
jgi:hypothetical protein